jgi:hypothetical protein
MKLVHFGPRAGAALLVALSALPFGCKDEDPCDPGQELRGTGCFPIATGGSAGSSSQPAAGAPAGGATDPGGNPDATFGTPCTSDADCGGDAPVCDNMVFNYCLQINCKDGEENAGACPADWQCVLSPPHPSACIKL